MPTPGDPVAHAGALAFEQHPEIALVLWGADLRIVAANASARRLLAGKALLGRPVREAMAEFSGQGVLELYEECFASGERRDYDEWRVVLEVAEGQPVEAFFRFSMVPLRADDETVVGVLATGSDVGDQVRARREARLEQEENRAALVRARDTVLTLQTALLPTGLPLVPGVETAAAYLPAMADTAAGGDWYDAVVRDGGRIALVVGDIVGHGVLASAAMGGLRAVVAERLAAGATLVEVVAAGHRYARLEPEAVGATIVVVELDPASGRIEWVTAGHPPPLVVQPGGEARFLTPSGTGPLGTHRAAGGGLQTGVVGPDAVLVLVSDGLIERPGISPARSTVELAHLAEGLVSNQAIARAIAGRPTARLAELLAQNATRRTGHADDVTVLVAQRTPVPPALEIELDAGATAVRTALSAVDDWMSRHHLSTLDRTVIRQGTGELVANAVVHGYGDPVPGSSGGAVACPVELSLGLHPDGVVELIVVDRGRWRTPTPEDRPGRGLVLLNQLADEVHVAGTGGGTRAVLRHRPHHLARLLAIEPAGWTEPPSAAAAGTQAAWFDVAADTRTVRVHGALDHHAAGELRLHLEQARVGGAAAVTVDLGSATFVGSAALQVLHELSGPAPTAVRMLAPPESPAAHVLTLSGLPYEWRDRPL